MGIRERPSDSPQAVKGRFHIESFAIGDTAHVARAAHEQHDFRASLKFTVWRNAGPAAGKIKRLPARYLMGELIWWRRDEIPSGDQ